MNPDRTLRFPGLPALLAALLLAGCTTIPQRELQTYRKAFDEARAQSENVLADHAAARQVKSNLVAAANFKTNPPASSLSLSSRLGLSEPGAPAASREDDISIRLKAWAVVGAYNEALAAVAAGAKASEIEGAVKGFLGVLQKFPVKEVAKMAGDVVPYAGVISGLLEMVQKEVEARRFRQAVLRAEEPMKEFDGLLRKDAVLFQRYRVELLNDRFFGQQTYLVARSERFQEVISARGWNPTNEVTGLVQFINQHRLLAPGVEAFYPVPEPGAADAAAPNQDEQLIELRSLADAIQRDSSAARATVEELNAYHELMRQYELLLGELARTHTELADAARRSRGRLPSSGQLQQVIASVRLAHKIYTETK